jgi:hypothetical protein
MTNILALQILANAQAIAPLTEAQRNHCYEALNTLRPLVIQADEPTRPNPPAPVPTEPPAEPKPEPKKRP